MDNMKVNVLGLVRPKDIIETVDITDPANPGVVVTFNIRGARVVDIINIGSLSEMYTKLYALPQEDGTYLSLPPLNGEPVPPPSEAQVTLACTIHSLQVKDENAYTVEEILLLMEAMPEGIVPLLNRIQVLTEKFSNMAENPTKAATQPHSQDISITIEDTQNSMHESTLYSGQSTKNLADVSDLL